MMLRYEKGTQDFHPVNGLALDDVGFAASFFSSPMDVRCPHGRTRTCTTNPPTFLQAVDSLNPSGGLAASVGQQDSDKICSNLGNAEVC